MDQEINDRLNRIEKMVSDNNRMLTRMRRAQKNAAFMRIVYWLVIIGLFVASYYLIQPYISQFAASYGIGSNSSAQSNNSTITSFIKQYQASQKTTQ
jgi:hypothetical protein